MNIPVFSPRPPPQPWLPDTSGEEDGNAAEVKNNGENKLNSHLTTYIMV